MVIRVRFIYSYWVEGAGAGPNRRAHGDAASRLAGKSTKIRSRRPGASLQRERIEESTYFFILCTACKDHRRHAARLLLSSLLGVILHAGLPVSVSGHGHGPGVEYAQGLAAPEQLRFWADDNKDDGKDDDALTTLPFNFAGLNTFAKLPYADCFTKDEAEPGRYDIAILGAPHDTVRNPDSIPVHRPVPVSEMA